MAANEMDSREKLAADMLRFVREVTNEAFVMGAHEASWYPNIGGLRECIADYLDRQAAITRRETRQSWQDAPNVLDRTNLETIAKLTADVKKWADAANGQRLVAMEQADKVQELTVERDELRDKLTEKQRVCDIQRESFRKMEADLAATRHAALGLWRRADTLRMAGRAPSQDDLREMAGLLAGIGIEAS